MRFADIPGQEDVKARLLDMADNNRIPHALLLEGSEGVGKFALARAFAQYIHCQNRTGGDSCGVCPSCQQHQSFNQVDTLYSYPILKTAAPSGLSADLFDIWKKFLSGGGVKHNRGEGTFMDFDLWLKLLGNTNGRPVIYSDESLEIIRWFSTTSYSSRFKILLQWLPERMQPECANKMLKLVEEPLDDSLLIFVSDSPQEILPTVYSRLQRIKVKRLPDEQIRNYLTLKAGLPESAAEEATRLAGGSLTEALRRISAAESADEQLELFMQLMRLAYMRKIADLRKWSEKVGAFGREGVIRFLDYCVAMMRENFLFNLHMPELNTMNGAETQFATKFSPFINERNVESLLHQFELAKTDVGANGNAKIVLFHLAVIIALLIRR